MSRPGVMIYFSTIRKALPKLSWEEKGRLFEAIMNYGEYGEMPNFEDSPMLDMVWCMLQEQLDRDNTNYEDKVKKNRYATYCREADKTGKQRLNYKDWQEQIDKHRPISSDIAGDDTISNININSNSNSNSNINSNINPNRNISDNLTLGKGECERENLGFSNQLQREGGLKPIDNLWEGK